MSVVRLLEVEDTELRRLHQVKEELAAWRPARGEERGIVRLAGPARAVPVLRQGTDLEI
jgi:hypothetical protein